MGWCLMLQTTCLHVLRHMDFVKYVAFWEEQFITVLDSGQVTFWWERWQYRVMLGDNIQLRMSGFHLDFGSLSESSEISSVKKRPACVFFPQAWCLPAWVSTWFKHQKTIFFTPVGHWTPWISCCQFRSSQMRKPETLESMGLWWGAGKGCWPQATASSFPGENQSLISLREYHSKLGH